MTESNLVCEVECPSHFAQGKLKSNFAFLLPKWLFSVCLECGALFIVFD